VRDLVTTLLDTAGLGLLAAGVTGGLWVWAGAWALCAGGAVLLGGSQLATWLGARGEQR
jgi:hypothetical protein